MLCNAINCSESLIGVEESELIVCVLREEQSVGLDEELVVDFLLVVEFERRLGYLIHLQRVQSQVYLAKWRFKRQFSFWLYLGVELNHSIVNILLLNLLSIFCLDYLRFSTRFVCFCLGRQQLAASEGDSVQTFNIGVLFVVSDSAICGDFVELIDRLYLFGLCWLDGRLMDPVDLLSLLEDLAD